MAAGAGHRLWLNAPGNAGVGFTAAARLPASVGSLVVGGVISRKHCKTSYPLNMKKLTVSAAIALSTMFLLSGCVAAVGNRPIQPAGATLGQQLIDLQKAKEAGAISEAEFEAQKAKLLGNK